jgi:CheY-like chemotaxis protein
MEISTKRRGTGPDALDYSRNGASGRVLIVDDDPALRLICAVNLNAEGIQVLEAADGLEALEQARCGNPDVILTDVAMPGLDGFQLAERLRQDERTRRIPLIFLSGEVGQANAQRARALGALAYLTKPFDPGALAALVAQELAAGASRSLELTATDAN